VRAPGAPYSNKRLCLLELRSRLAADPRAQGAPIWMRAFGDETTCPGSVEALELICRFTTGGPGFGSGPAFGTIAVLASPAGARPVAVHVAQNQSPYTCKHVSGGLSTPGSPYSGVEGFRVWDSNLSLSLSLTHTHTHTHTETTLICHVIPISGPMPE
jgi:hypothetical protein